MAFATIDLTKGITGVLPSANATYSTPRKNAEPIIQNGDMAVAQRSTSVTGITSDGYKLCDRWYEYLSSLGTYTFTQEAQTSGNAFNNGFRTAFRIDCTTADGSPSASDEFWWGIKLEGRDLQMFKKGSSNAEKFTLAFWVKSNKTGTGQVNFRDTDNSRMCSGTYTISSADTWEHKIINIAADTTGAFTNDNAESLQIQWYLDSGSNYEGGTAPTAWESDSATDRNAAGTLNIGDNTANDWAITGVQLEVGEFTSATLPPFQHESFGDNLLRCERYYQTICEGTDKPVGMGQYWEAQEFIGHRVLPTTMRTAPTLEYVSGTNYYAILRDGGSNQFSGLTISSSPKTGNMITWYLGSGQGIASNTKNRPGFMRTQSTSSKIAMSSEL